MHHFHLVDLEHFHLVDLEHLYLVDLVTFWQNVGGTLSSNMLLDLRIIIVHQIASRGRTKNITWYCFSFP